MLKFIGDAIETYVESARLILILGFIVFAVLLFPTTFFSYVVAGAGFVRYSNILTGSLDLPYAILLAFLSLFSLVCLAFLSVGATMAVKFRRSLDDMEFSKFVARFPKYVTRLTVWWIVLGAVTFAVAFSLNAVNAPSWASALTMLLIWAFFIFIPQSLVLHEKGFRAALRDSAKYCLKKPLAVLVYYIVTCILLFALVLVDVLFGQFFLSWVAAIINSAILFIFVIPFLEILKTNLFVTRYKLLLAGLK